MTSNAKALRNVLPIIGYALMVVTLMRLFVHVKDLGIAPNLAAAPEEINQNASTIVEPIQKASIAEDILLKLEYPIFEGELPENSECYIFSNHW